MLSRTTDMTSNRHRGTSAAGRVYNKVSGSEGARNVFGHAKTTTNRVPAQAAGSTPVPVAPTPGAAAAASGSLQLQQSQKRSKHRHRGTQTDDRPLTAASNTDKHVLARPQSESTRWHYEALISRGISLLQPYTVLYIAEAYHGWYHSSSIDSAGSILRQTIGRARSSDQCHVVDGNDDGISSSDNGNKNDSDSLGGQYDIRSTYWLGLCYWHMGEVSTVYSLLGTVPLECDYIVEQCKTEKEAIDAFGVRSGHSAAESKDSPKMSTKKALACSMWLLAISCTRLEKWQEAEDNLAALAEILKQVYPPDEPGSAHGVDTRLLFEDTTSSFYSLPTLADVSDLLGLICLRTNRTAQSERHSLEALRRNPLSWSSCRRLCELGSTQRLCDAFSGDLGHMVNESQTNHRHHTYQPHSTDSSIGLESTPVPASRIASSSKLKSSSETAVTQPATSTRKPGLSSRHLASGHHAQQSRVISSGTGDVPASARMRTRLASQIPVSGSSNNGASSNATSAASATAGANLRVKATNSNAKSTLDSWIDPSTRSMTSIPMRTPARSRVEAPLSVASEKKRLRNGSSLRSVSMSRLRETGNEAPVSSLAFPSATASPTKIDNSAILHLYHLVKISSKAFVYASTYRSPQALLAFSMLTVEQRNSAWGLCLLGRICFESGRYPEALQAFSAAQRQAPYRMRDMDMYSTLLWHMKKEEELANLAHTMVSVGRNWSPEAWVAVANCFSLDGDHGSALKSLGRSIQLFKASHGGTMVVPRTESGGVGSLAYAHTLVGHESVANDDLDRAQQAFRTAIRIDSRHYNAWYGMGMVYLRLGKLDLAEYHFGRALTLNAQNPLLLQSAGAVYEHRGDYGHALEVYERVEALLRQGYVADNESLADGTAETASASVAADGTVVLGLQSHHAMNFVMFKRARVLVVLERFAEAAKILEQLLCRCPREFNVPFLLGQTYAKLRRFREAAACLTRALDISPENSQSVNEAFDALYQQSAADQEAVDSDQDAAENSDANIHGAPRRTRASARDLSTPPSELGRGHGIGGSDLMSPVSSSIGSPYFDSPSVFARGRRGQAEWSHDWSALNSADDRVDRALDFDM
ncbi:anaphase-promoting complex subunit cdc27 [Coemansia sp. RSA 1286]|nr:anaphase-promoting complex subunit cdc27 [Coemansia sp. RSA 1286]